MASGEAAPAPNVQSVEVLYGQYDSVEQRFPGTKGKVLMDLIWQCYVVQQNANLKFFDDTGKPLLTRHHLNKRWQACLDEWRD